MSLIKGLHHVHLKCKKEQFEDVLHFYADILGLKLLSRQEDCAILDTGDGMLEVFNDAEGLRGQGDIRHFAFLTDDVRACIEAVEKAGYQIKEYPVDVIFALAKPVPARIAFCYGVLGEEVEFFQILEEGEDGKK